jgi:toxin ParE1/3/4
MSRIIRIDPRAHQDTDEQLDYYMDTNPDAALRFHQAVQEAFREIAEMPGIGSPVALKNPRLAGLRRWPVTGFPKHFVFYIDRAEDGLVEMLRVLHGSRDLESILEEMED